MALRKCTECGAQVSTSAAACPQCGAKPPRGVISSLARWFIIIFVIAPVGIAIFSTTLMTQSDAPSAPAAASKQQGGSNQTKPPATRATWTYSEKKDAMTGGTVKTARLLSSNTFEFDFPYQGQQHATLTLRKHPKHGLDVILSIERGQFVCSSYDGCQVSVRIDDAKASTYTMTEPEDHSTEVLFFQGAQGLVSKLKAAKTVRIEANMYREGNRVFTFDVAGLKW